MILYFLKKKVRISTANELLIDMDIKFAFQLALPKHRDDGVSSVETLLNR